MRCKQDPPQRVDRSKPVSPRVNHMDRPLTHSLKCCRRRRRYTEQPTSSGTVAFPNRCARCQADACVIAENARRFATNRHRIERLFHMVHDRAWSAPPLTRLTPYVPQTSPNDFSQRVPKTCNSEYDAAGDIPTQAFALNPEASTLQSTVDDMTASARTVPSPECRPPSTEQAHVSPATPKVRIAIPKLRAYPKSSLKPGPARLYRPDYAFAESPLHRHEHCIRSDHDDFSTVAVLEHTPSSEVEAKVPSCVIAILPDTVRTCSAGDLQPSDAPPIDGSGARLGTRMVLRSSKKVASGMGFQRA